jgi:hypothetical protein
MVSFMGQAVALPRYPFPSRTRLAASVILLGMFLTWLCAGVLPAAALFALRLIGLLVVLGLWQHPAPPQAVRGGLLAPVLTSAPLHLAIWSAAVLIVSYLLYHVVGEPVPRTGGLALGSALLAAIYAAIPYMLMFVAVSWYASLKSLWRLLRALQRLGARAPSLPLIVAIAGSFCLASWGTTTLIDLFNASIAVDLPYALAIDDARSGSPLDPALEQKGRDSALAFAFALGTTKRVCPGISSEDRLIGLDAHRVFDMPAITTAIPHGSMTTWPLDKGRIEACENGQLGRH